MIVFKYKQEPSRTKEKFIKRPVADLFLKSKSGGWIEFHPYIDSGADVTLIPLSLGKLIGLKLDENKVEEIGGIRGSVPVIYHDIQAKIGGIELCVQIAWALIEDVPPLLGRETIFDYFHITFKQDQGVIIFEDRKYFRR